MRNLDARLTALETYYGSLKADEYSRQTIAEMESFFEKKRAEYNSPEMVARQKAFQEEYERVCELRRQAFYAGRSMDEYPLPSFNTPEEEAESQRNIAAVKKILGIKD